MRATSAAPPAARTARPAASRAASPPAPPCRSRAAAGRPAHPRDCAAPGERGGRWRRPIASTVSLSARQALDHVGLDAARDQRQQRLEPAQQSLGGGAPARRRTPASTSDSADEGEENLVGGFQPHDGLRRAAARPARARARSPAPRRGRARSSRAPRRRCSRAWRVPDMLTGVLARAGSRRRSRASARERAVGVGDRAAGGQERVDAPDQQRQIAAHSEPPRNPPPSCGRRRDIVDRAGERQHLHHGQQVAHLLRRLPGDAREGRGEDAGAGDRHHHEQRRLAQHAVGHGQQRAEHREGQDRRQPAPDRAAGIAETGEKGRQRRLAQGGQLQPLAQRHHAGRREGRAQPLDNVRLPQIDGHQRPEAAAAAPPRRRVRRAPPPPRAR